MLPYSSNQYGGYGYGRRKGIINSPSTILGVAAVLILASLGFAFYSSSRASRALASKSLLSHELDIVRAELDTVKNKYSARNTAYDQLEVAHQHTQRRLSELTSQLARKEADLTTKDSLIQQHVNERNLMDQHRNARENELTNMVEDLRKELLSSDTVIDSLEKKVQHMEQAHTAREEDWHKLATTWVKYEEDLHEQYKKCTEEVAKLRNLTAPAMKAAPLPEHEPKVRPESDFEHINVNIPSHQAHHFDPLPTVKAGPAPRGQAAGADDLPLPEAKIRESIAQMTGGKVGGTPADQHQQQHGGGAGTQEHAAPTPVSSHHNDHYDQHHGDFAHDGHGTEHWDGHHYDHYHGHYDSYDPMDQYWMRDAHGDWNADEGYTHPDLVHGATTTTTHGDHHDPHGGHGGDHGGHGGDHGGHGGHYDPHGGHYQQDHHQQQQDHHHQQHQQHQQHQEQQQQQQEQQQHNWHHHHQDNYHHDPYSRRYNYHEQMHNHHQF